LNKTQSGGGLLRLIFYAHIEGDAIAAAGFTFLKAEDMIYAIILGLRPQRDATNVAIHIIYRLSKRIVTHNRL